MTRYGTSHFVSFTKACDYYRDGRAVETDDGDDPTPAQLEKLVHDKIADGEITIGKPDVPVGGRLLVIDDGTRYAIEESAL